MKPEAKSTHPCAIIGLIAAVLTVLLVGALLLFLFAFTARRHESAPGVAVEAASEDGDSSHIVTVGAQQIELILDSNDWREFSPTDFGSQLSAEQFIAIMKDPSATSLRQSTFLMAAQQTPVNWLLRLEDVIEKENDLQAQFSLHYAVRTGTSISITSVRVLSRFDEQARERLMKLRRGDWAWVRGQLSFDLGLGSVEIENAQLGDIHRHD